MEAITTAAQQGAASLPGPGVADVLRTFASVRPAADRPGMIDQLRELEDVQSAAAAKQARIAVANDLSARQEQAAAGVPADELGAGVTVTAPGQRHTELQTPTGHTYQSTAPSLPGTSRR
jgi:hypothetical protein